MQQTESRENIIGTLELISSADAQLAYQKRVPIAHVSAELLCAWDDVFWSKDSGLQSEFSDDEWAALQKFDETFQRVVAILPAELPIISEFQRSQHWLRLSRAAARARESLAPNNSSKLAPFRGSA